MTDVDASLLYFCSLVARHNKVTLTGECADEIFGGYPWFYRPELLNRDGFPWSADVSARAAFLSGDVTDRLDLAGYSRARYEETISASPKLPGESPEEARRRAVGYLNIKWFMQTLLDRMDRTSMYSGLEARVPFADHRIMEYVFNVPWSMKYQNGVEKRCCATPARICFRQNCCTAKKPVPEDLPPGLREASRGSPAPDHKRSERAGLPADRSQKAEAFLAAPKELGRPWFGQLMAGPQLMAYFIQLNDWMEKYQLSV